MGTDKAEARRQRALRALTIAIVLTFALYVIPFGQFLLYPLMLLSTFAHEMGHGLSGLLVGGRFESFVLFANGSGVARTTGVADGVPRAILSAGGLVGPALLAAALFLFGRWARGARMALVIGATGAFASAILVVDNLFGWVFVGLLGATLLALAVKLSSASAQIAVVFVAGQLALSVFSRGDYLFMREAETGEGTLPSDTAQIADALGGTYWLWGLAVGAFSLAVLGLGLWSFARAITR